MNSKRIISLILSILMTLQVFAFQTPVNAMEGVNPTIQKSEGQKIGKRSEVFEFKNNEKPNWFYTRRRSLFGARDVGLTKSEKVKIETTATGLDEGEFNWEAFGQNKKFNAWIEVAYAGDVNEEGEPIRHKVSEDFEINKAGTIDTNITVDASKTVENYFIVTEYDEEPDSFNINAFFDRTTIKSDKGEKSIAFKLDVHQIVSTKITYNLIDEYGKAIDLTDTNEAKPADTDLANLGKIGDVTTFNLKNEGTENLWQEEMQKDEPSFDESDLTSSSLALALTKNQITSNNIDYKLTSTYDVIKGGKVTIQRQKDVVTPKDPKNPGGIPEGYARIKLVADETGNGSKGTFNKDNPQDTQRVVDVRAGKPYTTAQTEIDKQAKPFPLTSENKVDTGKTFKAWDPELNTLGNAVADETKTLHATYQTSKEEIIPYLPGEEVPTKDKDGLPIPTDYVNITFNSESESKGKVKIGDKEGATVLAKVKPGIDLSQKAEITTVPAENYGFTEWKPALTKAAANQTYTAYFVKSGDKINEGNPIPKDWFKVTVSQDKDSIKPGTVTKAVYAVKPNDKLGQDKFADVSNAANDGYKDPAWYVGSDKVERPYEVAINSSMDFVARATELESHKITKDNGLKPVDFTAYKGDEMGEDFWKKGVKLEKANENLQKLLDAAKVTDATTPARTTVEAGEKTGTLKVTFSDGSFIEVQNQKLTVIDTKVEIDYGKENDKDANAPRHNDEVVKGEIKTSETVEGAKVEILDSENNVIGITLAKADGSFIAGTRKLQAGEKIKVRVTLPKAVKASEPVEKVVKLNADRLNELLKIANAQKDNFSKKQNAIIKEKLEALGTAITEAEKLVDKNGKAIGEDTAKNQTAIDSKVKALEEALKALTANIPPTISGPKTHEIFVGEDLDLEKLVDVTDGDGADDLVEVDGSKVKVEVKKVDKQTETPVADLSTIKDTVGTYKVTYTAKDKSNAEVTHEMTLTVKPRTTSAIEVTKDPTNMSYLITEKNGKAKLNLDGMTLNLVDNLGKKTKVELTDPKVKFKVNDKEIKNGGDLTLEDDVKFIEVEYTPEGSQTPLKAQTKGVLRVGPDYDKDGTDDRTQNFDPEKIEKLVVVKQPQLDYIAKDKSEADKVFKLNLEGMIVRMTDKAGKEKLAIVKEGKFYDYDEQTKEITQLTATPAHGATLTPQTSDTDKGHNGSKVTITGPNNSKAETEPLKVFYDANKDGNPDYGQEQKTPAPSAMARNVGENPKVTTVEGMATPGAVIKITDKDGTALTTEPKEVVAGPDGKYTATIKPMLADGTEIKVTAKLGEMGESDPTEAKVFDDKNDNKQPDRDEGFNIAKATDIKFVDQPDLTYLVKTKETEVTFDGKDGKGKPIYLELSYKNGKKTESKIMTLEELMKDNANISVTPANGTKDKIGNDPATLVGKNIEVKLKNVVEKQGATEDQKTVATATSTNKFAIEIDADGNGKADEDETTATPTVTARNIGTDNKTTVEGTAPKGSTVTIKYTTQGGQVTTKTVTAGDDGKYTADITPKLEAGIEVKVTAKDGEKKVSPEVKTQVFDDKDNDGKDDKSQNFDITKADKIEMVYDPAKMNYLVTSKDGKVALETKGMVVKVTDKAGVEKKFTAEEIAKDTKNFTVVPANGTEIGLANNDKQIKVTLNVKDATTKEATTSNLSVKLDANGNGIDDEKEKLDLAKVTGIKIIKQPQLNYPITTEGGKTNINLSDMVVELTDGVNKANYTAQELLDAKIGEGQAAKAAFKLELVQGSATAAPTTTAIEAVNKLELTTANDGNKVQIALAAKADVKTETEALQVFEDLDGDGKRDSKQTPAPKVLKALNKGNDTFTTITGKATKGDTLKVYGEDKKEIPVDQSNITIDENGNFTIKVSKDNKALDPNTTVFVTAQAKDKEESARIPVVVQVDKDGNGTADKDETTTITSVIARNIGTGTTSPKTKATFTTIEGVAEPGSTVTITFTEKGKSEATTKTVEANKTTGAYKLELKGATEAENILLPADTVVKASAKFGDKKPSGEITTKVFEDLDADGKADNPNANKTERPSALAYNFKDEAKTTIKGEAEPGAKVIAKVGKTIVGEATANSDGKYEISATKDGAKLLKGTKVSVTATLAPKGESPAQETVVYEDLDGDGQPDTSQAFDKDKIRGLEVVASPNKMVYNNKEQLNLTGMKVLLTDQMGNMKIVEFSEFGTYGITVNPLNKTELSYKNVADRGNNGQKIKAEVKVVIGNNQETYSGETPTALEVNKDQSAQPTDVEAANQGTKTTTTVRGKATPGAKVEVKNPNGQVIGTVDQVPANGEFQVEVTKQADKAKVKVTATEPGKAESAPQEAKVFRDKNGDWKDDKGGKVEIEKPVVDPIKVGDESVKVKIPGEGITKITVKDEKGKTIDVVKDGNDWKVDGKIVGKDGDKLVIPTKDKGLDFGAYEKVEITNHDDEGNEGKIVVATKPANLKPMEKPTIDPISTQSTKITGKSLPGSKVLVYLPGDTDDTAKEALVKSDGSYELTLSTPLADKSLVKVKATNTQRDGVGEAETKVGLNTKQLEDTKTEADGLINDSKTNNNFDPDNNKYDKNLEDKTKAAQDILERAKDNKDDNDPTQTQVNTAEKELRDAINQKGADDKVKVVEKLVKDGQKPSEEDINKAQEAIDKVTDPTAKKELQDRLDKAKALDELKDAKDDLDKVIAKAVEENKPKDETNKAKKESEKADEIIKNGGDGKTAEDLVKEVESIKEITKKLGQPAIQITIDSAIYNGNNLIFTTNPGRCKIFINIYHDDGTEKTIETTTGPAGSGSVLLDKPLQVGDYIEVKATRKLKPTDKPDYLDNSTSTYVY
ncbi:MAG: Ig-like domain-containing protein [Peptostreptococcus anaerobius]|uniref:Ig-like domain-containing protein n=1 Tax=Peptostreptococcus anaerobius TaxID=1261 RepID=UPI00290CE23F|nr:Ig-like domain-containing protein [Peptostreptococcus anaerobius]MDU5095654.1 Ig-like domain-containing protein [Peptostreptococcus anaerobius]